ncbi:MAG: TetR/AcrR family transcriptional regulator [Pararhodobacter sp.]
MSPDTATPASGHQDTNADKGSAARRAILEATAALLAEQGLSATRTRDVTARAGVSTGLLNHYFTWGALRAEALGLALRAGLDAVLPTAGGTSPDPRGELERLAQSAFDEGSDPLWRLWVEATEAAPTDPAVAQVLAQATGDLVARIADRLDHGAQLGLWRCADPQGAAFRLMALHDGLAGLILSGLPGLTRADATAHLATALALECPPFEAPQ